MGSIRPFHRTRLQLLKPAVSHAHRLGRFLPLEIRPETPELVLKNARILRLDFCRNLQIFDAAVHTYLFLPARRRRIPDA